MDYEDDYKDDVGHNDYDCCAVCDRTMGDVEEYGGLAKEVICPTCIPSVAAKTGTTISTGEQLLRWIKAAPAGSVAALGINRCHYPNLVDIAVKEKLAGGAR